MIFPKHVSALAAAFVFASFASTMPMDLADAGPPRASRSASTTQELAASIQAHVGRDHREPDAEASERATPRQRCEARGYDWQHGRCVDHHCPAANRAGFTDDGADTDAQDSHDSNRTWNGHPAEWEPFSRAHTPQGTPRPQQTPVGHHSCPTATPTPSPTTTPTPTVTPTPMPTLTPIVRDHREPTPTPIVRDHREPTPTPIVRDHREPTPTPEPTPIVRDHRR